MVMNDRKDDLKKIDDLRFLAGQTILVTGGTGLIGKALISAIMAWNRENSAIPIRIIAVVRDSQKAIRIFGSQAGIDYVVGDVKEVDLSGLRADYIIHAASQTASKSFVDQPVETIFTAIDGTRNLLEFARQAHVKRFLYLSTMEVYGTPSDDGLISEDHPTNLNTANVRACYPISKRMCENMCISYQAEYGVPVNILRLTQTFGPGTQYNDKRVFAEFARCVIEQRDIILKTTGGTARKYLYTEDAINAFFTVLKADCIGEIFNVANDETYCSIREMAEMVATQMANGSICVRVEPDDISKFGYSPELHMNLDTTKLRALGWRAQYALPEMFENLIESMKSQL